MSELEAIESSKIENMIYEIRGVQVMLDSDLAKLFQCETGNLNRARLRNKKRFPNTFSFQITKEEYISLKCQFGISNIDLRKINRNLPYVYTEQGVAMLSSVLHTDIAITMSIEIIDAFVRMRKYISNNLIHQNYVNNIIIKHEERISLLENTLNKLNEKQKINSIFYEGQIFDAYVAFKEICDKAKEEIIIIDNYAGKELLKLIKDIKVNIVIITKNINEIDYRKYEKQYSNVDIKYSDKFHDSFIIIDKKELYHCGCSFKDLGEKCFAITKMEEKCVINDLLNNM